MSRLFSLVFAFVALQPEAGTSGPLTAAPSTCDAQPEPVKHALVTFGRAAAGILAAMDDDPLQSAQRAIEKEGSKTLPCLLSVYRHGLVDAGLWTDRGPDPEVKGRILALVAAIDPQQGITLYREQWREASANALRKASLEARMALLGAQEYLPSLVAFLASRPPVLKDEEQALDATVQLAVDAVVKHNYAPALDALRDLEARGWRNVELPVHIAQLSGNADVLRTFLDSPRLHSTALLAFKRLGKDDVLAELAQNPNYRYRDAARLAIAGKLGR